MSKENSNVVDLNAYRLKKELATIEAELQLMATDPDIIKMIDDLVYFLNETYYTTMIENDEDEDDKK